MPSTFGDGGHVIKCGGRNGMDIKQSKNCIQYLIGKVHRKTLGDAGDAFRGRPPHNCVLNERQLNLANCQGRFWTYFILQALEELLKNELDFIWYVEIVANVILGSRGSSVQKPGCLWVNQLSRW
jgi:hypothetical protein